MITVFSCNTSDMHSYGCLHMLIALVVVPILSLAVNLESYNNTTETSVSTEKQLSSNLNFTSVSVLNSTKTTPIPPENLQLVCQQYNDSCDECVKQTRCYYCYSTNECLHYPFSYGFPRIKDCNMGEVRWAICWFNLKALIISLSVMAGTLFVSLSVCIYCGCRTKKRSKYLYAQQQILQERDRETRQIQAEERRNCRMLRNDEIRKKYGLIQEDLPYQRFDA